VDQGILKTLEGASPAVQIACVRALALRGVSQAHTALLEWAKRGAPEVQAEVFRALGILLEAERAGDLIRLFPSIENEQAKQAILEAIKKIAIRAGPEKAAFVSEPLIEIRGRCQAGHRASLLELLPMVPGPKGLEVLREDWRDPDETIKGAALRALAEWPSLAVAADLLEIAGNASSEKNRTVALRGYLRLLRPGLARTEEERIEMARKALQRSKGPQEKKLLLGALSGIAHLEAFRMARPFLDDPQVVQEACAAILRIAESLKGEIGAEVKEALEAVVRLAKKPSQADQARQILLRGKAGKG
jgi:HEAT repeat protein